MPDPSMIGGFRTPSLVQLRARHLAHGKQHLAVATAPGEIENEADCQPDQEAKPDKREETPDKRIALLEKIDEEQRRYSRKHRNQIRSEWDRKRAFCFWVPPTKQRHCHGYEHERDERP